MTAATWAEFEAALAREIPLMRRDDTVVLDWPPFYVQLGQDSEYLVIEAVSNDGLPADRQLTTAARVEGADTPLQRPVGRRKACDGRG